MAPIPLNAGPLRLVLLPGEGAIRYLFAGEHEVLRGIGAPIRDRAWATVRPEISDLIIDRRTNSFRVTFTARCRIHPVDLRWRGELTGSPLGTLIFDFDGEALENFHHNRIGFCVLHPAEIAGAPCIIEHTHGHKESCGFPRLIQTGAPFRDVRAISHEITPGLKMEVQMDGDTFETEDQRNWTDASFKTYCTPLSLPRPALITKGTRIHQRVTVRLYGTVPAAPANFTPPWCAPTDATVSIGEILARKIPALGTVWNTTGSAAEIVSALRPLRLAHLRLDLWLKDSTWIQKLSAAAVAAEKLKLELEIAVFVNEHATAQFSALRAALPQLNPRPRIARWLVFHENHDATPVAMLATAREAFNGSPFSAPVGGGGTDNFTELNYHPELATEADFTVHACNPQVHAFDEASISETLPIQGMTVSNARQLSGGRPAVVSPVMFTRRWRLTDTDAPGVLPAGLMPFQTDQRHTSKFAAAWTLGSVAALANAGAVSATYFEATGDNGLVSLDVKPFPVYHTLAAVAPFSGASVVATVSSHPLSVVALAFTTGKKRILILANLRATPLSVKIDGTWNARAVALDAYEVISIPSS